MKVELQKEHQWLQQLVGDWTYETMSACEPGGEPQKFTGTESIRSLGGVWVQAEGHGQMPDGAPAITMMTLGYDTQKKRFVGTWIGTMMTNLWIYDGALDATERSLALESEGPDMAGEGKTAKYRDTIEFKSADQRVQRSEMLGPDGKWTEFMSVTYQRKK